MYKWITVEECIEAREIYNNKLENIKMNKEIDLYFKYINVFNYDKNFKKIEGTKRLKNDNKISTLDLAWDFGISSKEEKKQILESFTKESKINEGLYLDYIEAFSNSNPEKRDQLLNDYKSSDDENKYKIIHFWQMKMNQLVKSGNEKASKFIIEGYKIQ